MFQANKLSQKGEWLGTIQIYPGMEPLILGKKYPRGPIFSNYMVKILQELKRSFFLNENF